MGNPLNKIIVEIVKLTRKEAVLDEREFNNFLVDLYTKEKLGGFDTKNSKSELLDFKNIIVQANTHASEPSKSTEQENLSQMLLKLTTDSYVGIGTNSKEVKDVYNKIETELAKKFATTDVSQYEQVAELAQFETKYKFVKQLRQSIDNVGYVSASKICELAEEATKAKFKKSHEFIDGDSYFVTDEGSPYIAKVRNREGSDIFNAGQKYRLLANVDAAIDSKIPAKSPDIEF